jgi:hypothetical protein
MHATNKRSLDRASARNHVTYSRHERHSDADNNLQKGVLVSRLLHPHHPQNLRPSLTCFSASVDCQA